MSNTHHFQAYLHSKKETLQQYSTSLEGIDSEERKRRLEVYGPNALEQKKATPIYMVILAQFTDPMIILLLICAVLARFMNDIRTAAILLLLVVVNAGIGYQQEAKAERLIASLKNMMQSKAKINVYGQLTEIDATRVVP
jgi:Ca2+-transporting ATPase